MVKQSPHNRKPSKWFAHWQISQISRSSYSKAKSRLVDRLLLIAEGGDR